MKNSVDRRRVVIAVTESSPLPALWREAMNLMRESPCELLALFMHDDRWLRAASLPFTQEISRVSGAVADFTAQRAEQLKRESIARIQSSVEKLASEAQLTFAFEVLPESDQKRITDLLGAGQNVLIAHTHLQTRPIYTHLNSCGCRILLIESADEG